MLGRRGNRSATDIELWGNEGVEASEEVGNGGRVSGGKAARVEGSA